MKFYKMPFNPRNLKTIKYFLSILMFLLLSIKLYSQGVQSIKKIKIDGVVSVVGDYVILDSDIDKMFVEMEANEISTEDITRCQLIGKLMEDKLYAHHAIQDSLEINDEQIYGSVEQTLEYFTEQLGSIEAVLEFYDKGDEASLREELFRLNKERQLASLMRTDIVEDIEITPEEVRQFFIKIPEDSRPVIGTELEISQIVIEPEVSKEEEDRINSQLKNFREDVLEGGSSFASKAILYSQDPGSRSNGGKYTLHRKRPRMVKEFRDVAFSLQEGEISDPFKTEFGWHILSVDKVRGQEVDVRHILLVPRIDITELNAAKEKLNLIRKRIVDGEISFKEAAIQFSNEKQTRFNGGVLINPETGDTRFELTKLDPVLFTQIRDLDDNEITPPLLEEDRSGGKKYKILKVSNRFDEHTADFSKDFIKIKELAQTEKQLKAIKDWISEKIDDTYISVNTEYKACDFANNWLKSE